MDGFHLIPRKNSQKGVNEKNLTDSTVKIIATAIVIRTATDAHKKKIQQVSDSVSALNRDPGVIDLIIYIDPDKTATEAVINAMGGISYNIHPITRNVVGTKSHIIYIKLWNEESFFSP